MQDSNLKKIRWRCRRGTKELDVILERFVSTNFETLGYQDKQQLDRLLDVQDPTLTEWLCQNTPPPDEFNDIVSKIKNSYQDQGNI